MKKCDFDLHRTVKSQYFVSGIEKPNVNIYQSCEYCCYYCCLLQEGEGVEEEEFESNSVSLLADLTQTREGSHKKYICMCFCVIIFFVCVFVFSFG